MQMNHATFARSSSLRLSLKRGLARQAIDVAARSALDLPGLFEMTAGLRPNAKGLERLAARLKARPGVVRVVLARDGKGLTFTARAVRAVEAQVEGETAFHETGLIYLRARVSLGADGIGYHLGAVSFCRHALERLVERTDLPLDTALLPKVDAEAQAIFRGSDQAARIIDEGDEFFPAAAQGVWAGGYDGLAMEADWGLMAIGSQNVPIFSVRTFLSPDQMRPTVWLRWKNDPSCRIV
jgi:hypothetical protein